MRPLFDGTKWRLSSDVPYEYLQEIGFLAVECAWIDTAIIEFIGLLAFYKVSPKERILKAECLVGGEPSNVLLSKLSKLFNICISDQALQSEFKAILEEVKKVYSNRGLYVHSCLLCNEPWHRPDVIKAFKITRGNMRKDLGQIPLSRLTKACNEARSTNERFLSFFSKVSMFLKK